MQGEEDYTTLNLQPQRGGSGGLSPAQNPSCRRMGVAGNDAQSAQSINDACLSAGGPGCKLCPTDWQLRGDKCYWVSRRSKMWSESHTDCSARGSQLLVIRDPKELDLTQDSNQFWVGLSVSSPEKAWTWLDGSRLDQTQFPVSGPAEGNSCGAVKGNQLHSDTCSSVFQWIWYGGDLRARHC
uniref:C-type lectin domain-containing protein n=1 Tax=Chrysemys picta bellii TaxID=8478 RepID=A0A8C3F0T3_CHRPI